MVARRSGFTLLEVMVALLFLSVAIIPISLLLDSIYSNSYDARNSGAATYMAQKYLEELVAGGYASLPPTAPPNNAWTYTYSTPVEFSYLTVVHQISKDTSFNPANVTPHTGSNPGAAEFKRIKVIVSWGGAREGERVELIRVKGNK